MWFSVVTIVSSINVDIGFYFGVDVDPVLLVLVDGSKVYISNVVVALVAVIAWSTIIAWWVLW